MTLVCPKCRAVLADRTDALACEGCHALYPIREGIPYFEAVDSKYEDTPAARWDHTGPRLLLPFVDGGMTWFFSKYLKRGGRVLDIGCGVGMNFVADRAAESYGVDLAPKRLKEAQKIYDEISVASILALPYPDNFFDAVISVDVIEHIPADKKDDAIREMIRVLRNGGRMMHILDLDSQKPLYRWAKGFPELFQEYFVDQMGHYGLETATSAMRRFDSFGMNKLAAEPTNRTMIAHPENYAWQFDNEYLGKSKAVKFLTSLSYFIRRHPVLRAAYSGFYELIWTRTLEKLFPVDWSFNLAVAYEVRK